MPIIKWLCPPWGSLVLLLLLSDKLTYLRIYPALHLLFPPPPEPLFTLITERFLEQLRLLPRSVYLSPVRCSRILHRNAQLVVEA